MTNPVKKNSCFRTEIMCDLSFIVHLHLSEKEEGMCCEQLQCVQTKE